jgi:hypothetical protein
MSSSSSVLLLWGSFRSRVRKKTQRVPFAYFVDLLILNLVTYRQTETLTCRSSRLHIHIRWTQPKDGILEAMVVSASDYVGVALTSRQILVYALWRA